MSESKQHTPGPWDIEDPIGADVGLWIVQRGLETYQWSCIATVPADEDRTARDAGGRFIGRSEQRANAALIAAAPKLLVALRVASETIRSFDPGNKATETGWEHEELLAAWLYAEEAIADAEGKPHSQVRCGNCLGWGTVNAIGERCPECAGTGTAAHHG